MQLRAELENPAVAGRVSSDRNSEPVRSHPTRVSEMTSSDPEDEAVIVLSWHVHVPAAA
jgi:hypothetical protein